MDREYYEPMIGQFGLYLTPEQIRHEKESYSKIFEKYRMSNTGMLRTFSGAAGVHFFVTFLALKRRGPVTNVLVPLLTGGLTSIGAGACVITVSVFLQMIIIS